MNPVMNQTESMMFEELRAICEPHGLRVMPKMRVADVFSINNTGLSAELYSFALQAHFDFTITDTGKKPLLAIEFDGPTHQEPGQIERDNKKNQISTFFGLKLLRLRGANLASLRALVEAELGIKSKQTTEPAKKDTRVAKQCKKCNEVFIVQNSDEPLPKHKCFKDPITNEPPQAKVETGKKFDKKKVIAGCAILAFVVVVIVVFATSGKKDQPQTKEAAPQPPVVQVVFQPTPEKVTATEKSKEDDKTSKKNNSATEKQMDFLKVLANKKGWKDSELDKKSELTLGYRRKFADLNKAEASTMIDAWK